jgi:hypothetical protein
LFCQPSIVYLNHHGNGGGHSGGNHQAKTSSHSGGNHSGSVNHHTHNSSSYCVASSGGVVFDGTNFEHSHLCSFFDYLYEYNALWTLAGVTLDDAYRKSDDFYNVMLFLGDGLLARYWSQINSGLVPDPICVSAYRYFGSAGWKGRLNEWCKSSYTNKSKFYNHFKEKKHHFNK